MPHLHIRDAIRPNVQATFLLQTFEERADAREGQSKRPGERRGILRSMSRNFEKNLALLRRQVKQVENAKHGRRLYNTL
jgi:hypothetical protein